MDQSGIDIVIEFWKMLNVPILTEALGQGEVWQHNIPMNSPYTEVVVSIPTTDAYESQLRFVDIDIRTPNLGVLDGEPDYYPHKGLTQDNTFPDMAEFKRITDIILPLIQTTGVLYVETRIPGVPVRDADGTWRVNIRVQFTLLDSGDTLDTQVVELIGQPDGFGGYAPTRTTIWEGNIQRLAINLNPHLEKAAGNYGLYMRCSWLIPRDQVTPQKNMHLVNSEGEYVITGIFPEGVFWRLTTTRKDADN